MNISEMSAAEWGIIGFTIRVAALATLVVLGPGIALAWILARRNWPGKSLVETAVMLPIVMPPVATGLILLELLGRNGPLGKILYRDLGLTILLVAHDLAVVRYISQRVAVMYLGAIVELAETEKLVLRPSHPYSRALLTAVPKLQPASQRRVASLQGDPPSPLNLPSGCRFHTRCPRAAARCAQETPSLREIAPGHLAACHFAEELLHAGSPIKMHPATD